MLSIPVNAHWVNSNCETSIAGLYAGEVASGKDGANRLGGNTIPTSMSMGIIADRSRRLSFDIMAIIISFHCGRECNEKFQ